MINKFVYLGVQGYRYSNEQRDCLLTCRSNLSFGLRYRNLYTLASVFKGFEKIAQTVNQTSEFSFGDIHFFLEDITLLCL